MAGPDKTNAEVACDAPQCQTRIVVEIPNAGDVRNDALEAAFDQGWGVTEHGSGYYSYCPEHQASFEGKTPSGRTVKNGGAWER